MESTTVTKSELTSYFFDALPHFFAYFGASIVLAVLFLFIYQLITPQREWQLIREGKAAPAISLMGAFLGFAIPMAIVISHSVSMIDMAMWGAVVLVVQLAVFFIIEHVFKGIAAKISEDCISSGVFLGGTSLGIGILNAACMVP